MTSSRTREGHLHLEHALDSAWQRWCPGRAIGSLGDIAADDGHESTRRGGVGASLRRGQLRRQR